MGAKLSSCTHAASAYDPAEATVSHSESSAVSSPGSRSSGSRSDDDTAARVSTSDKWYWGHADSEVEPPNAAPTWLDVATVPLMVLPDAAYWRDFARFALCPTFLEARARGHKSGGCPFLGGTAYVRHADVRRMLAALPEGFEKGALSRRNELGYFRMKSDAFPGAERTTAQGRSYLAGAGTLSLGAGLEEHRVARRWLEHLLDPRRLPKREAWMREVEAFLGDREKVKLKNDVAPWWQEMMWKHVLGKDISREDAEAFVDFQNQWVISGNLPLPGQINSMLPDWLPKVPKIWSLERLLAAQKAYREDIAAHLPAAVPAGDRLYVAQAVLEAFAFAGGLSVPITIRAAVAALYTPALMPADTPVTEKNVEAFVYEVTRLFPAVQGFCFWRDGQREILSLNAALRDPSVWGEDAHRFTLKDVGLYRASHVGFAGQAAAPPGTFDSRACPGERLALDVLQAFVLVVCGRGRGGGGGGASRCTPGGSVTKPYWSISCIPRAARVPEWFKNFELELEEWLDGDQTGEDMARGMHPVHLGRLSLDLITPDSIDTLLQACGVEPQPRLRKMDVATRAFHEIAKMEFRTLSKHESASTPDLSPAEPSKRYYVMEFEKGVDNIRLPMPHGVDKTVRELFLSLVHVIYRAILSDEVDPSLIVRTPEDRLKGILLCQEIFKRRQRGASEQVPPASSAQLTSYLPRASHPISDITTDASQVGIARCGIGQLFLRRNTDPALQPHGEILCDASLLGGMKVRPAFERLGAVAVFKRNARSGASALLKRGAPAWTLTAIDWKHGGAVVKPGDANWEHAKFVWRCSLFTHVTAVHHLVWNHWIVANGFATSVAECLNPHHPVRRLLQVFAYNTAKVNYRSVQLLHPNQAVLHRMVPFPYEELVRVLSTAAEAFKFQTWPELHEETDLDRGEKDKLPMFEDGLPLWAAFHKFCSGYVGLHYATDASVQADGELREYWKFKVATHYARGLPALSKAALVDQMTHVLFNVTAYHKLVGGVVEYSTDPAGAVMQVRPGLDMSDMEELVEVNSLVSGTGTPMPMLVPSGIRGDADWLGHLDLRGAAAGGQRQHAEQAYRAVEQLYRALMADLRAASAAVQRRNASGAREHAFSGFDPVKLERSVSL